MNITLFWKKEIEKPLPLTDQRAKHIITILGKKEGDFFEAGIINEQQGKGKIEKIDSKFLYFSFDFTKTEQNKYIKPKILLLTAMMRPIEAKKILKNLSTIGVSDLYFTALEKTEKSYCVSSLWKDENYKKYLVDGATQGFTVDIPKVELFHSLIYALTAIPDCSVKVALDNYETETLLGSCASHELSHKQDYIVIAVGGERGWSSNERKLLKQHNFTFYNLGRRVLKTETACIASISIILSKIGYM